MRGIQVDNPVLRIGNVLQAVTGSAHLFARADLADTADPRGTQSANLDFFLATIVYDLCVQSRIWTLNGIEK